MRHTEFETYKQALDTVKNDFEGYTWATKEKQKSEDGDKDFFKCSECEKRLYILKPKTNSSAILYVEEDDHVHVDKTRGVPELTKQIILKKYFEEKNKPKEIMRWLRANLENGYVEVDSVQLNNLIQTHKKKQRRTQK